MDSVFKNKPLEFLFASVGSIQRQTKFNSDVTNLQLVTGAH